MLWDTNIGGDDPIFILEEEDIKEKGVEGEPNIEPFIHIKFHSVVEVKEFYKSYDSRLRSSIRINTSASSKEGLSSMRTICSK